MKKQSLFTLRISVLLVMTLLSIMAFGQTLEERYATVTNVRTTLNMRKEMNSTSAIVGKLPKDTRVQVMSNGDSEEWVQIKYNDVIGYVKSDYLQMEEQAPTVKEDNPDEENAIVAFFLSWRFYILLVLAIMTYSIGTLEERDSTNANLQLGFYIALLIAGILLVQPSYELDEELKCWFTNEHWIKHAFNVLMLTIYLFVVLQRYFTTCYRIAEVGLKDPDTTTIDKVSISFFIWLIPLMAIAVVSATITYGVSVLLVLGLAGWKIYKNCIILRWQYSIMIAILGLIACYVSCLVFYSLVSQILLLILEAIGFAALLKSAPSMAGQAISNTLTPSTPDSNTNSNDGMDDYDVVIKGAGVFGGDVKGKTFFDGSIKGENGTWYKETNDGKVVEKEY